MERQLFVDVGLQLERHERLTRHARQYRGVWERMALIRVQLGHHGPVN